ncbi:MAG: sigma-70 family RNA polymerase sigma factor [Chloroflexi bacterium]|nr:sigma-70 family RNA polymerase sigma factor [Chloroflexota bacterium]
MQDLVDRAQQGDRDAFAALASSSVDRLYATAQRILRDTERAHDAVQETLLEAWRDLPQLRQTARFDAWLYRVLVRACYRQARRDRSFQATIRVLHSEPAESDASQLVADRDLLERAFNRLSVDQRAVVVLHHYVGLDLVEVAAALGIPVGTARSRLHYALRGLRFAIGATPVASTKEHTA